MMEDTEQASEEVPEQALNRLRISGIIALLLVVGGFITAWLQGQAIIPGDPGVTIGFSILMATILICCGASLQTAGYSQRIIGYQAVENVFAVGKDHYDRGEWEEALDVFRNLLGPDNDHKRALYYGARCLEQLGRWNEMKDYCERYLELVPDDSEVWDMLSTANKRLFEYDGAKDAKEKADGFR